jgi:hypothetical protein
MVTATNHLAWSDHNLAILQSEREPELTLIVCTVLTGTRLIAILEKI